MIHDDCMQVAVTFRCRARHIALSAQKKEHARVRRSVTSMLVDSQLPDGHVVQHVWCCKLQLLQMLQICPLLSME